MAYRVHPTKQLLINTVSDLLEASAPGDLTSDEVIQKSGISRGSLYHHFEDFSELIAAAQVARFSQMIDESIDALTAVLIRSDSRETMMYGLRKVTQETQSPARAKWRYERAAVFASAGADPRMKAMLGLEQQRLTDAIADIIREAQERGLFNKQFDPRAGAILIQAYTLGKIVDDVVENPVDSKNWEALIMQVIEKIFVEPNL